ncbi:GNAT family N-acetyltransferase [Chitinophaga horti]|uniref:GNAT family N-acetyltransferase n=1 Tax=Chitinophaga horti TaxID=2920382 RepID=A0ABY6J0W6_9BACT|nr:GNAT family N-acetyltransferase [Chitinophaga horti]UYQ91964.1 GNAT family N-acetyltransferase [Chitinophaga horti]
MDVAAIHLYLSSQSYWAAGIPYDIVESSLKNSFCVGVFENDTQVGFARLVTDYATFGYLADVYVLEEHRGKRLSKLMLDYLFGLPWTKGLRRTMLVTLDAHYLYTKFDFKSPAYPERIMELKRDDVYAPAQEIKPAENANQPHKAL